MENFSTRYGDPSAISQLFGSRRQSGSGNVTASFYRLQPQLWKPCLQLVDDFTRPIFPAKDGFLVPSRPLRNWVYCRAILCKLLGMAVITLLIL